MMRVIDIPERLTWSDLGPLTRLWPGETDEVLVRLRSNRWVTPAGMVGLACLIDRHRRVGGDARVDFDCAVAGYWERMGFFREAGIVGPDPTGVAREPHGRFAEMRRVLDMNEVDDITAALVSVLCAEADGRRTLQHILAEAANNVCQHSFASGFSAAQAYQGGHRIHLCIADSGRGLLEALKARYQPRDDAHAITLALKVGTTSNPPIPRQRELRNRGVGLARIERLVAANQGSLTIWSGNGLFTSSMHVASQTPPRWNGTLMAIEMRRDRLTADFRAVMRILADELRTAERQGGEFRS